jgi:UDP-N-acetylglucosamine acyltransferase
VQRLHPAAVVDPGAKLADDVVVGPFAFVGPGVELGPAVTVGNHVSVSGPTQVGARTALHPFAAIGGDPQDKKYRGEPTRLVIGADCRIHEGVTIHRGTPQGGAITRIGDDVMLMNGVHVAHDCQIASHVVIASFSGLAGHVEIGEYAVLAAYTGVHQHARIGESAMTAANAKLAKDAPPFSLVAGDHAKVIGLNSIGMQRRGIPADAQRDVKHAFHLLFASKLRLATAIERVRSEVGATPEVQRLLAFIAGSRRGVLR